MSNNPPQLSLINPTNISTNDHYLYHKVPCIKRHHVICQACFPTSPISLKGIPGYVWWEYVTLEDIWNGIDQLKYKQKIQKKINPTFSHIIEIEHRV